MVFVKYVVFGALEHDVWGSICIYIKQFVSCVGANLDHKTRSSGETPLMIACKEGHVDVVNTLVEAGEMIHL